MKAVWAELPFFQKLVDTVQTSKEALSLHGPDNAAAASLVAELSNRLKKPLLVIVGDSSQAVRWVKDLKFFFSEAGEEMLTDAADSGEPAVRAEAAGRVILFPELHQRADNPDDGSQTFRAHLSASLHSLKTNTTPIGVAPVSFLAVRMEDPGGFEEQCLVLKSKSDIHVRDLMAHLMHAGYSRVMRVENPGDFAYRGGILDIYIPLYSLPVRIEFFGDEIVSIREFDALTQRSISRINTIRISTAVETGETVDNAPFIQTLPKWFGEECITLWLDPDGALQTLNRLVPEYEGTVSRSDLPGHPKMFWDLVEDTGDIESGRFTLPVKAIPEFKGNYREMVNNFRAWVDQGYTVNVVYHRESVRKVVMERMTMADLDTSDPHLWKERGHAAEAAVKTVQPEFITGLLSRGFCVPETATVFVTEQDIVGKKRRQAWRQTDALEEGLSFQDLHPGDLVVHVDHGIGRYDGLHRLRINGKDRDFLLLRYADDQKLYLPVDRLHLIQQYRAISGAHPRLDKMGGIAFRKRKKKVRESVLKLAAELIRLFSKREVVTGFAFPADDAWQREFELGFEYEETPDQLKAIHRVKSDMEMSRPMDRIVCGDVGYGKTEVAMRAAFKAAVAGRQVAVLVPTTILAQQHFRSFQERFSRFPLKVAMLSRFLNARDRKEVLKQLANGHVDIIIGTHALLGDSVRFADLGLLIIDEEHRFGVRHKEKLKKMRAKIDVLTLTATPIPRTLNMSMLGLREISLINTPPETRLPIKTRITKFNRELIRRTILEEINRNGQVFFVHNRVQSIYAMAEMLRNLVPEVRFAVAHGQMSENKLERIMLQFLEREFDVLICTTIIESGLDIPSVNTIIINRADKLGLAQLYQLRGRVGRDRYQAYALLLVPATRIITEKARERLSAVREAMDLGSGFRLATRDLDIRGAGDILGANQHGHISAVGFDMYCKLIREAVQELRGEHIEDIPECEIKIPYTLAIPEKYIEDPAERLEVYRRFSSVNQFEQIDALMQTLRDRFGAPPEEVYSLAELTGIRVAARSLALLLLEYKNGTLITKFHNKTPMTPEILMHLLVQSGDKYQFSPPDTLFVRMPGFRGIELVRKARHELETLVSTC